MLVSAYLVPAALAWSLVGLALNVLPLSTVSLIIIILYALLYGLPEASGNLARVPGIGWQVPARWVRARKSWQKIMIWGSILGPGFVTVNPYAGFWLLPPIVASAGSTRNGVMLAVAVGTVHGVARALALLHDLKGSETPEETETEPGFENVLLNYKSALAKASYWRLLDGCLMLIVGSLVTVVIAYRLG